MSTENKSDYYQASPERDIIAARDATIAEQAEALEGYRTLKAEEIERIKNGVTGNFGQKIIAGYIRRATHRLPAHEIAALRQRGVEVGG